MLNAEGHTQARDLTARVEAFIGNASEVRVVSSSLGRAKETATPVAELFGTGVTPRRAWDKLTLGEQDGLTGGELYGEKPDELLRFRGDETFRASGGESRVDLHTRVCPTFERFIGFSSTMVVTTHWGPIMSCISLALRIDLFPARRPSLTPVSAASFMITKQNPQAELINDLGAWVTPLKSIWPTPVAPLGFGARGMDLHSQDPRYFVAVVEEDGFSRAAERLFVSQPMLS